jgi:hypothetical protein
MKKLILRYQVLDENNTTESAGEMALELSSTVDEIIEFQTTVDITTKFEHFGIKPKSIA